MATTFLGKKTWPFRIAIIIVLVCFLLVGCNVDYYAGKRPFDYGPADWVCEDPEITIHIREIDTITLEIPGLNIPDTTGVAFLFGRRVWIIDRQLEGPDVVLLDGECSFSPTKLKVRVTQDDLFDGKYEGKTIIFNRFEVTD